MELAALGAVVAHFSIHALLAESDCVGVVRRTAPCVFYPRSPCGERRCCQRQQHWRCGFSIHALLAESDPARPVPRRCWFSFLSTLSLRRATSCRPARNSVHSLFYPRSPCGERRRSAAARPPSQSFSIHALLAESDTCLPLMAL